MSDMRRLIEAVDSDSSKTKVDEALPLAAAAAAAARVAAPYVARAGSAIMKGLRGSPKPPAATPKPPVNPPVTTPAGATPPIPANVNIPAVVRNKPATPPASTPPSAPASPATAGAKPPAKPDVTPAATKPKIERRPGETTADAVKRAQAEKGVTAPKPAEPTVPATPKPAAGDKPAVWRDPRTGEISSTPPGAGRPATSPATPKPAEPTVPATPKPAAGKDPVGSARPGGAKDIYGRRDPLDDIVKDPSKDTPDRKQPGKKRSIAAAMALHGGLGGLGYLLDRGKAPKGSLDPERQPVGGAPAGGQPPITVDVLPDAQPAAAAPANGSSKIDLPSVGPQNANSPFYVVPGSSPEKVPDAVTTNPTSGTNKSTSTTPSTTAGSAGAGGTGGSTGADTGAGSEDEQIERNLRRMGVINETLSQRLLNDFINYVESNSKSKAK